MCDQLHNSGLVAKIKFDDIILGSDIMKQCVERAKKFADTDGAVLILGESGTGKEVFAQSIHTHSLRKDNPFVAINCAALQDNLLESELFGYEEGAFTGAKKGGKLGLFEMAHKGTLFLDELGALSNSIQARLLRVLQEKQLLRIGGTKVIPIDVRIVAATNENLKNAIKEGSFRHDLYYRLNVLNIVIPPLRKRRNDIPVLVNHFVNSISKRYEKEVKEVTSELMAALISYDWPGNVRELINYLERLVILSEGPIIGMETLYLSDINIGQGTEQKNQEEEPNIAVTSCNEGLLKIKPGSLEYIESQIFDWYDVKYQGNKTKIADKLGICRTTIWKRFKNRGIPS